MDAAHAMKCELACESLLQCGTLRLKVNGSSMVPTIWPEDVLMISTIRDEEIRPGQIALYRRNGRLFVHRVIGDKCPANGEQVLLRGDCMPQADPPVPVRDLLGKVDYILRNGKKIAPGNTIPLAQRAVAAFVQSSVMGARAAFGMRRLYRSFRPSTPQWEEGACQY